MAPLPTSRGVPISTLTIVAAKRPAKGAGGTFFAACGADQVESGGIRRGDIALFRDRAVEQERRYGLSDQQRDRDCQQALAQQAARENARHWQPIRPEPG